jgi:hypothetical protein
VDPRSIQGTGVKETVRATLGNGTRVVQLVTNQYIDWTIHNALKISNKLLFKIFSTPLGLQLIRKAGVC